MELDPLYCDVIVERWEKFTGRKAQRESQRVLVDSQS
jgi:DNA modification methylase